jgi:hypothetical protein
MYRVFLLLCAFALSGCGLAMQIQAQEQAKKQAALNAQLLAQSDAAVADCNARIPRGNPKTAVARVKCLNDAFAIRLPTFGSDSDLAQTFMAYRAAVAEQEAAGKISDAQAALLVTQEESREIDESQRRHNATASASAQMISADAQQQAAAAARTSAAASMIQATRPPPLPAPAPINPGFTCIQNGNMTTCN